MAEPQNIPIVQGMFAAFGRGDIASVLDAVSEDVDWQTFGQIPQGGQRRGRAGVGAFFAKVGEILEFSKFEPRQFIAQGDAVVALGGYTARAKHTGRSFDAEWAMVFTFRTGKVVKFREYVDTGAMLAAL